MSSLKPRVLLTNDDGPPGKYSPYIFGLWRHLSHDLGWDVKVVVPSSQKSWIGAAYQIKDIIHGRYYYPQGPDGSGEVSEHSRSLKEGELGEWILFDGTPATCANIALHNLYHNEIDLVISGPNLGRNTSAAFSLSSGTLGAALSSALSRTRAIALSYGTMKNPVTDDLHAPAHVLSARIISHLVSNWGHDSQGLRHSKEVDYYSINLPMVPELHKPEGLPIRNTAIWRNGYNRLFEAHHEVSRASLEKNSKTEAGPDAAQGNSETEGGKKETDPEEIGGLVFKWAPEMKGLLNPTDDMCPSDTDASVLGKGFVSVTPIRARYAQPEDLDTSGLVKL